MGDENADAYYGPPDDFDYNYSIPCPSWAPIVGFTGIACAVIFASK
jgi:hypothetical protein